MSLVAHPKYETRLYIRGESFCAGRRWRVCHPDKPDTLRQIILPETTPLGVRRHTIERASRPRFIRVKVARWHPIERATPEY